MSPPPTFGTYRVLHQIGSGVLGPVFRAYDSQQDRLVAIKTIKLDLVPEDAVKLADQLRALTARPLAHRALVGLVDAGLDGTTPFLALEYASGESLDVVIRQSRAWPLARALPVLREIAAAIDASWVNGAGHGALHPRDIFVGAGIDDLRITGFGIGQALDAIGARVPLRRPYSAPERGTGAPWDVRADVYSLGVVAHEILSGHRPVGPDDDADAVAGELAPESRAAVRRVLAVAMADSPGDRYETAAALVDALAATVDPAAAPAPAHVPVARPFGDEPDRHVAVTPAASPEPTKVVVAPAAPSVPAPRAQPIPAPSAAQPIPAPSAQPIPAPSAPALAIPRPLPPVLAKTPMERDRPAPALDAVPEVDEPEPAAFPWVATAAVFVAGMVLSGVIFYQLGWQRGRAAALSAAPAAAVPPIAPAVPTGTTEFVEPPAAVSEPPVAPPAASPATTPATTPVAVPKPAATGRVVIQSTPSGALVTLDGQRVGETPLTLTVPVGRHDIQIARSGYVPKTEHVDVTAAPASHTLRVQLRRGGSGAEPAVTTGSADVDSRPRGARVTLDGRVGVTPLRIPELTAGGHRVQIDLDGHKSVTSAVNIVAGQLTRVAVTLEQGKLAIVETPRVVR